MASLIGLPLMVSVPLLFHACNQFVKGPAFDAAQTAIQSDARVTEATGTPLALTVTNFCSASGSSETRTQFSLWAKGPKGGRNLTAVVHQVGQRIDVTYLALGGASYFWDDQKPIVLLETPDNGFPDCSD